MKEPVWVFPEVVLGLHEQSLEQFGGSTGIRDAGLLESALGKPKNQFAYANAGVFELAASYAFGIVKNHPFIDGNKRTGITVAILFIELNGYTFQANEVDATISTLALAAGEMSEADFATWLQINSIKT